MVDFMGEKRENGGRMAGVYGRKAGKWREKGVDFMGTNDLVFSRYFPAILHAILP
jgi:hypothetical protein